MAKFNITIDTILNGQSPTYYRGGSYLSSFGINPNKKINGKTSAVVAPTSLEVNGELDGNALWIVPNPYTNNSLLYTDTGWLYLIDENNNLLSVDESSNAFPVNLNGYGDAHGNGLEYYNNYYYIFKDTDIDRYGPMSDTANLDLEVNWWTSLLYKKTTNIVSEVPVGLDTLEQLTVSTSELMFNEEQDTIIRASAQRLTYGVAAISQSVTLKKFDIMFRQLNGGAIGSQVGDIRVSLQTESGGFPSGTRLREVTVPIRTINFTSVDFDDVNFTTVFPDALNVLASLEFDTEFEWLRSEYIDLFLVIEVINTTGLTAGIRVGFGDLGDVWETPGEMWSGYAVVDRYSTDTASWGWENYDGDDHHSLFFRFYDEEPLFINLENPQYEFFFGDLPNHSSHVHDSDNNLYFPDANKVGRIQTRDSVLLGIRGASYAEGIPLTPGNTLVGETSGARATIVNTVSNESDSNQTVPVAVSSAGYVMNQKIVVEKTLGNFVVGEIISNLEGIPFAKLVEYKEGFYTGQFTDPSALVLNATKDVTDIASYGLDLAVLTHQNKQDALESSMILWDAVSTQFTREVPLQNSLGTAIFSGLGSVNVFYGDEEGYSLGTYVGGERFSTLFYRDDSHPPFPGAVYTEFDRVLWGTKQTYPENRLSILSYGMTDATLPQGVHNLYSVNVDATATALGKYPNLGIFSDKVYVENDGDPYYDGKVTESIFRTSMYPVNGDFDVRSIKFSLERPVDEFTLIDVYVYYDNESRSELVDTISSAKFSDKRVITLRPNAGGYNNFFVEFRYRGDDNAILLPINISVETKESA